MGCPALVNLLRRYVASFYNNLFSLAVRKAKIATIVCVSEAEIATSGCQQN
jgi:hypothetical protein